MPDRKALNPAELVVFNQIHDADTSGICLIGLENTPTDKLGSWYSEAITWDLKPNLLYKVGYWALTGRREWSRPELWCDWEIMTLAVEIRPGASLRIGLWWNGNCKVRLALTCMCTCHSIYIGMVSVGRCANSWCGNIVVLLGAERTDYIWIHVQITVNMRVRCLSWSYDPIYHIMRLWPDSYQEWNASNPDLHEHDILWEFVAISVGRIHSECKMQHMLLSKAYKVKMGEHA